jgi:hypothetical protein
VEEVYRSSLFMPQGSKAKEGRSAFSSCNPSESAMFVMLLYLEYTVATYSLVAQKCHTVSLFYILTEYVAVQLKTNVILINNFKT